MQLLGTPCCWIWGKAFAKLTGLNVEDHQIDLYYYFKKSTRRKGNLQDYVEFIGETYDEIIRFGLLSCDTERN